MKESKGSKTAHNLDEVKRIIGGKADLYEAAIRNGWYLPKYKSTIITEHYLQSIIFGKMYCPKYSEIRLVPCPRPPDKDTLLKDFRKITSGQKLSTGIDETHVPDKSWLLAILGTHNPGLPYFQKGYVPPAKVASIQSFQKVELPENFLEGLPSSKRKMKVKNLRLLTDYNSNAKLQRYKILKDKFAREYIKE